jgi:hypothetical protein
MTAARSRARAHRAAVEVLDIVHGARPYEEMEKKINALLASK